ncbi:ABC transporter ATP-binding protein [Pollutibacter soli]|uniref:ABC transporter ATP-binding protein n=1 Tax=Pollutibacter soli TaxID=3034157 RepID=UPI0030141953
MSDENEIWRLTLENVSHDYSGLAVLRNLNLRVKAGEMVVIVGPSGCGKTTLLNLLSGYIKPSSGSVEIDGVIRTVYQQDGLFPWLTVEQNIAMGLRNLDDKQKREREIKDLVELIHLEGFEHHYPHQLSGGMRQRVELARVIAGDSDILLMDEPFSALDYQTRLRMRYELVRILKKRPRTVVFVTHDIEEAAQLADKVIVLSTRPAHISRKLNINTDRPRNPTSDSVIAATREILDVLGLETPTGKDI